jgi:hypothetical protein
MKREDALQPFLEDLDEAQDVAAIPATISSTRINTFVFIFVVFKVKQYKQW